MVWYHGWSSTVMKEHDTKDKETTLEILLTKAGDGVLTHQDSTNCDICWRRSHTPSDWIAGTVIKGPENLFPRSVCRSFGKNGYRKA